uniref:Uncharacterized protein n=2 Tax=Tetraselmis sp. GSL018 TaxID=582737 RepID=A0A061R712_9CHLO|mmetsp:Transcript_9847/g.23529  ORF Transcript_9847/g.23529 Transcript_9847/m.23529 type:complete len:237 (+) Transcript_9847:554-1264(+)
MVSTGKSTTGRRKKDAQSDTEAEGQPKSQGVDEKKYVGIPNRAPDAAGGKCSQRTRSRARVRAGRGRITAADANNTRKLTEFFAVVRNAKPEAGAEQRATSEPPAKARDGGGGEGEEEEQEVTITRVVGPIWNVDYAHLRHDCGVCPFSKKPCELNAAACSKCICYICDDFVANCPAWSKGEHPHCHAHRSPHFDALRERARREPAPRAGAATPPRTRSSAADGLRRTRSQCAAAR